MCTEWLAIHGSDIAIMIRMCWINKMKIYVDKILRSFFIALKNIAMSNPSDVIPSSSVVAIDICDILHTPKGGIVRNKAQSCLFCDSTVLQFARHLQRRHKTNLKSYPHFHLVTERSRR